MPQEVHPSRPPVVRRVRSAVTLVELVISLAIMGVLMAGLASAIVVASHALPDRERALDQLLDGAWTADQIAEELREALWFLEHTATAVTFTVADRDGDGVPERIRYEWADSAGGPLTRQYNGQDPVTTLDNVHEFALDYDIVSVDEEYPGPPVEGAEERLCYYEGYTEVREFRVEWDHWPGQRLDPDLPDDAVSWRVTRAWIVARRENDPTELIYAQIRPANDDGSPTDTVLAQESLPEYQFGSSFDWERITFADAGGLAAGQEYVLVLQHSGSGGPAGKLMYDNRGGEGRVRWDHDDWDVYGSGALLHCVYGKVATPGPTETVTRHYVAGVRITLRAGDGSETRVTTAAKTLNLPELLSGMWETDFAGDPTMDGNGDGAADWVVREGTSFDEGALDDSVWAADRTLDSSPDHDFDRLTTIEVRFCCNAKNETGATIRVNGDWNGGQCAPFSASLRVTADGNQTLTVKRMRADLTNVVLLSRGGLGNDFVTLRLLIDPDVNALHVEINGEDQGTYAYEMVSPGYDRRFVTLEGSSNAAKFDYISVRVAE